jgi:type IV pilus assembly protein PilY1
MNTMRTRRLGRRLNALRKPQRWLLSAAGLAALATGTVALRTAGADAGDTTPKLPNVLILLDNSASMEWMPTCYPNDVNGNAYPSGAPCDAIPRLDATHALSPGQVATSTVNRWGAAVQVLAGTFRHFAMMDVSRSSADFLSEYSFSGSPSVSPYDSGFPLDHYRIMDCITGAASCCTVGPHAGGTWNWQLNTGADSLNAAGTVTGKLYPSFFNNGGLGTTAFTPDSIFGWRTATVAGTTATSLTAPGGGGSSACGASAMLGDTDGLGILDLYGTQARFALMTFDTQLDWNSGYSGMSPAANGTVNAAAGVQGLWSYFPGWGTPNPSGSSSQPYGSISGATYAWPSACPVDSTTAVATVPAGDVHVYENGARNPSAPPWEGPLIPFSPDDTATNLDLTVKSIKLALWSARPYGGTPVAAMLKDAQSYLLNDASGPNGDQSAGCRGDFIILITDGIPNQDLRTACEYPSSGTGAQVAPNCGALPTSNGCCPNKLPETIAHDLANPSVAGVRPVQTFVIGFSLSDDAGNAITCPAGDPSTWSTPFNCTSPPSNPALLSAQTACCTLEKVAYAGTPPLPGGAAATPQPALFATDAASLRAALTTAMAAAIQKTASSRTIPVYAQPSTSSAGTATALFTSNFQPNPISGWHGFLVRTPLTCVGGALVDTTLANTGAQTANGDDFEVDLANQVTRRTRTFWSYRSSLTGMTDADTIRPQLNTTGDGVPANTGAAIGTSTTKLVDAQIVGSAGTGTGISQSDLGVTCVGTLTAPCSPGSPTQCSFCGTASTSVCQDAVDVGSCVTKVVNYSTAIAQPQTRWVSRNGWPLADIFHASPSIVSRPLPVLRDASYRAWATSGPASTRDPVVLVATNDGLLHGFRSDVPSDTADVEDFAFFPPAILPHLKDTYGGAQLYLLDSAPIVRDVAFGQGYGTSTGGTEYGRTKSEASAAQGKWATVALGALTAGGGYYAVDISDPQNPKFLWQLTTANDSYHTPMFGPTPGVPAIGTVSMLVGGAFVEVPVALLPGGGDLKNSPATNCDRWGKSTYSTTTTDPFAPRPQTPCWSGPGLGFTVARLADGKILRAFRDDPAGGGTTGHPPEPAAAAALVTSLQSGTGANSYAKIDSPITGTVAPFPSTNGSVTTRAFVGDADGTLWKLDLRDPDPTKWTFVLFHDAYNLASGDSGANDTANTYGQPISIPPVLTTDNFGNVIVLYATGNQTNFGITNVNEMYSITDHASTAFGSLVADTPTVNWHLKLAFGVTPTGPLSLFNRGVYFTTYSPPDPSTAGALGKTCLSGTATLFGVDYLGNDASPSKFPIGQIPSTTALTGTATYPTNCPGAPALTPYVNAFTVGTRRCVDFGPSSIIFGGAVSQQPTCVTSQSTESVDPFYLGGSSNPLYSGINPGDFNLVVQLGGNQLPSTATSGTKVAFVPPTFSMKLPVPASVTRVNSWAAIVE